MKLVVCIICISLILSAHICVCPSPHSPSLLSTQYNPYRAKLLTVDGNHIDCIFIDKSRSSDSSLNNSKLVSILALLGNLILSRATEQYCTAGAILKPLCLSKQLTLCSQQHIDQFFPGHIVKVVC